MALIKSIEQKTKFVTEYINIQYSNIMFYDDNTAHCALQLGMYKDEVSRKEGAKPIIREIGLVANEEKTGLLKKVLYETLKNNPIIDDPEGVGLSFENATDHIEQTDPDLTGLVAFLNNWEVKILLAKLQQETISRNIVPLILLELESVIQTGGTSDIADSAGLTLTFNVDPTTLTESDITVTGATKGALSGTGTTRTLAISNIMVPNGESVSVEITSPSGYLISGSPQTTVVYRDNTTEEV